MTEKWSGPDRAEENPLFRQVEENLKRLHERVNEAAVRAGRDPREITVMAVTKTVPVELINHAIACGIDYIGENRVQEFLAKREQLQLDGVRADIIGTLQTNKVRKIIGLVHQIQSVDSIRLAAEIDRISAQRGVVTDCLVEVNIGREESKSGVLPEALDELLGAMAEMKHLRVRGLMSIPPVCDDPVRLRGTFSKIRQLFLDSRDKKSDNILQF